MCGIAGMIADPGVAPQMEAAVDSLTHRGPDGRGLFECPFGDQSVFLGHRRLSIIDLSDAAAQPFEKDGLVLVFNGEIYNYRSLMTELRSEGVQFRSHSDTETVLEVWRRWGEVGLRRLRGMFAFALYNRSTQSMILVRDPFGIKPLYITHHANGAFAFASELKTLLGLMGEVPEINAQALTASLLYCWLPREQSIYQGITKLTPGTMMSIDASGQVEHHAYWQPSELLVDQSGGVPVTVERLQEVIEDSVTTHMVADVPVSTFLSGGLDSSIITVLAKRHAGELDSYTIGFRADDQRFEAMPDDLRYARQLAKEHGIRLHEIEANPDTASMLTQMVAMLDEPIGDSAAINTYLICQAARDNGVKVLLSGMGADELFGGYRRHLACVMAARWRQVVPSLVRHGVAGVVNQLPVAGRSKGFRLTRWAQRFMQFANLDEEAAYFRSYTYYDARAMERLMGERAVSLYQNVHAQHQAIYEAGPADDMINRMCFADMQLFMEGLNQTYTDRASMAASTEVRVPFIDIEMARLAFAMPGSAKIHTRQQKYMLKKAAEAWLPKEVIYRPKASFTLPLRAWMRHDLRDMLQDVLINGVAISDGWLQGAEVERMIAANHSGAADYGQHLWQLLTLELWLRQDQSQRQQSVAEAA